MGRRYSKVLAAAALLLFASVAVAAEDLDALLKQSMDGTQTPAIAVLVMREGEVEQQAVRGMRRSDEDDKASLDDVWLIGSTGKPMTAALIARLVERKVLAWDAPLEQMLPELADVMQPKYRAITLTQMLSHRSGLPENARNLEFLDTFFVDTRPLPDQRMAFIREALKDAPVAAPGTEFAYSNTGFLIAAVIAERKTKTSFEDLMRREVFQPLGMASADFGPTQGSQPQGHRGGRPVSTAMTKSDDGVPMMYTPAGNVHMSLRDLARFCLDQMAGSHGDGKLLTPASYRLMQTAQPDSPSGLDWGVQESIGGRQGPVLVHGGSDGNWLAWVVLFPSTGNGVLVVANAANDMGADKATTALLGALFPSLGPPK